MVRHSLQRRSLIMAARNDALANRSLGVAARALVSKLKHVMPSRIEQALDACDGDVEQAEALLLRFDELPDATFATKMKAAVRKAVAIEAALAKMRVWHWHNLVHQ